MRYQFGKAVIKLKPLFACDVCGKQETGDTVTLEVERFESFAELVGPISKAENRARDMPIGWRSYNGDKRNGYATRFMCEACKQAHDAKPEAVTRRIVEGDNAWPG